MRLDLKYINIYKSSIFMECVVHLYAYLGQSKNSLKIVFDELFQFVVYYIGNENRLGSSAIK